MTIPEALIVELTGGPEYQPILKGRPETCGMRSGCVSLSKGENCGVHTTGAHEEALVILEGAGTAHMKGRLDLAVMAGHVLYVPPHTEHNVIGGERGLRYVYVVAPVVGSEMGPTG